MPTTKITDINQIIFLINHNVRLSGKFEYEGRVYVIDGARKDKKQTVFNYNENCPDWCNFIPRKVVNFLEYPPLKPFSHFIGKQDAAALELTNTFRETPIIYEQEDKAIRMDEGLGSLHKVQDERAKGGGEEARLNEIRRSPASMREIVQSNFDFSRASLVRCDFTGVEIDKADLSDAQFVDCTFNNTKITSSNLQRTTFIECKITESTFKGVRADIYREHDIRPDKIFEGVVLKQCTLANNTFIRSDFSGAYLKDCKIEKGGWHVA